MTSLSSCKKKCWLNYSFHVSHKIFLSLAIWCFCMFFSFPIPGYSTVGNWKSLQTSVKFPILSRILKWQTLTWGPSLTLLKVLTLKLVNKGPQCHHIKSLSCHFVLILHSLFCLRCKSSSFITFMFLPPLLFCFYKNFASYLIMSIGKVNLWYMK